MKPVKKNKRSLQAELDALRLKLAQAEASMENRSGETREARAPCSGTDPREQPAGAVIDPCLLPADAMGLGIVGLTVEGTITVVNSFLALFLGIQPDQLPGTVFLDHLSPQQHARFKEFLQKQQDDVRKGKFILLDREGNPRPAIFSPFPKSHETPLAWLFLVVEDPNGTIADRESHPLPPSSPHGDLVKRHVVICDKKGCIIRTSGSLREMCGQDPLNRPFDDMLSLHYVEGQGEGEIMERQFSISRVLEGESFQEMAADLRRGDGVQISLILEASPLRNPEGAISGGAVTLSERIEKEEPAGRFLATWEYPQVSDSEGSTDLFEANIALQREILHRKQIEEALIESETRFRAIFEKAAIGMALVDLQGTPITANPALIELFGGCRDDLPVSLCNPLALEEEVFSNSLQEDAALQGSTRRDHYQLEKRYILKGGRLMWCQMTVSLIRDSRGKPHSAVVMLVDITQRRRAERALRQSEARYRAIVEDQVELVSRIKADYTYSFVNEAYCRRFGKSSEQLLGSSLWDHVPKKGRQRLKKHYISLTRENPVAVIQNRVVMPNGEVLWQQWTDRAIFDEAGRLKEIQSVGRDITKEKLAQKALQESEKQLRHLSAQLLTVQERESKRIAHELHDSVGQYLSAIKYGMENLVQLAHMGDTAMVARSLETLLPLTRNTIEEVRRIYMDLRPSLLDDLGIVPTVSWFCREFEAIYRGITIEKSIEISEEDVPEPLKIILFRILQEALNNVARHSQADRTSVSLRKDREGLEFTVRDNGTGFDTSEAWARHGGKGGLGLASMKERTELFGGVFSVESTLGRGTTVRAAWPDLSHLSMRGNDVTNPGMAFDSPSHD